MSSEGPVPIEGGLLYAEDLAARVGVLTSLGPATMTEAEIRAFAQRWDPLPIHVGDGGPFGGVIASGLHTFAVFQRLAVDAAYCSWAVVAGRAIREMVLPQPVFPGDVLTGWVRVNGASPRATAWRNSRWRATWRISTARRSSLCASTVMFAPARALRHRSSNLQRSGSGGSTCGQATGDDHG